MVENLLDMPIIIGSFYFYGDDDMLRSVEHHRQIIAALRRATPNAPRWQCAFTWRPRICCSATTARARPSRRRHDAPARARDGIALLMSHRMSKPPRPARRPGWGATRAVLDALAAQDIR